MDEEDNRNWETKSMAVVFMQLNG